MPRYDARRIEEKWQQFWEQRKTFQARDFVAGREKLYVLDMFPYPSGDGLHVGHPEGQTATDIICRHARMQGKNVLHPMGWDAFGLPAEQHAIKTGVHPRIQVRKNIDNFRRQEKMLGFSYDWDREFSTTDEDYFRWTQWIFLQLFDTWYDPDCVWTGPDGKQRTGRGRPIAELPIPQDVQKAGAEAVRRHQDKHRLAYQHEAPVNWCPALGTVLANEEVIDGLSERGNHPVERRPLRQWMLRITSYADRLMEDLAEVNWPESIKSLQRNWIGRSVGAEVDFFIGDAGATNLDAAFKTWRKQRAQSGFPAEAGADVLRVYTTRPDTLYGATYMVIAPEHPQADRLTTPAQKEKVDAYRRQAAMKSDLARTDLAKEKTGVFTGAYAVNSVNGAQVPVWVADYVLISYGTGAIMAVPAHDLRDWEFAVTFDIPIIQVVAPPANYEHSREEKALARTVDGQEQAPFAGQGLAVNSGEYTGLDTAGFKQKIAADLAGDGLGKAAVNFKLRDWLFSRQHYWGEPFPIWHELGTDGKPTGLLRAVPEEELPVTLPDMDDFKPKGTPEPPLAFAPKEWLYKTDKDGTKLMRETNSMPQWAGSCWYYLRFADPKNGQAFIDPQLEKYWLPVDLYIGGAEHAVLHLLYARFWHKVLFDRGWLSTSEPFNRLVNQGMILGEAELTGWQTATGEWVSLADIPVGDQAENASLIPVKLTEELVVKKEGKLVLKEKPEIQVEHKSEKMSKSRGNVINPDVVVRDYGADSLRLYEMFMGPLEQVKPWSMHGVEGVYRFLGRVWRMFVDDRAEQVTLDRAIQDVPPTEEQERLLHKTIKAVSDDIEKLSFNTAISRMMEFTNEMSRAEVRPRAVMEPFLLLLSPFAPHIAEELWQLTGHADTLAYEPWPRHDESKLAESSVEIPVQINGKVRAKIMVPTGADKDAMQKLAEASAEVQPYLTGATILKVVVVPGRMVNFVVKQ